MEIFKKHPQWSDVKEICEKLKKHGFTAWLAGGSVRDGLLGILPHDFDIASNAKPGDVEHLFKNTVAVGKAFGVIRVVCPSGTIEVARFRRDGQYSDGRHPDSIEPGTPEEDAERRDFTVNGLFYDPFDGKIHDYVHGLKDLKNRIIKTVGNPENRFQEDHLRILRAVRFVAQLDFKLEENTLSTVKKLAKLVTDLSGERVTEELSKLFKARELNKGVQLLKDTGLLLALFPEIDLKQFKGEYFSKVSGQDNQEALGWILLFSAIPEKNQQNVFDRLKMSHKMRDTITLTLRNSNDIQDFSHISIEEKRKLAARPKSLLALALLKLQGPLDKSIEEFFLSHQNMPELFISGEDILKCGVKPGKLVGALLKEVLDAQLRGDIKSKKEAIAWLKNKTGKNV